MTSISAPTATPVIAPLSAAGTSGSDSTDKAKSDSNATSDRFLKLLVAQMKNQDPLNPMDNAQVTSQMAQINTVNGIEKLNTAMQAMASQMAQSQVLQSASLVGRDVVVPGDQLAFDADGTARGAFELNSSADSVKVEILDSSGLVKDTVDLGKLESGTHDFDWPASAAMAAAGGSFRITAKLASGTPVNVTPLMRDRVDAVSAQGDSITLNLANKGRTAYADVRDLS